MIELEELYFRYGDGDFVLDIPRLYIASGEKVALTGPSGCGKTTLLHLIAGILLPHHGKVWADGSLMSQKTDAKRRDFRLCHIGIVFQGLELLEYLTVQDNILLPYRLTSALHLDSSVKKRAHELARATGIDFALRRYPSRLSEGERQRVAICRALITRPRIILADEPTGNLDPPNARRIVNLLQQCQEDLDSTFLMVTHDRSLAEGLDRVIALDELRVTNPAATVTS